MIRITADWKMPMIRANLEKRLPDACRELEKAVLKSCEPYVPYRTGKLFRSGHPSGSGTGGSVTWSASYASECYYARRSFGKRVHPHATARWFEAAKAADLENWCRTAASVLIPGNERSGSDGSDG